MAMMYKPPVNRPDRAALPPLIKSTVAAEMLSCTSRKITDMCVKGQIKAVRIGRDWRINTTAFLDQFGL